MKKRRTFKRFAAAVMSALMVGGVIGVGAISTSALDIDTDDAGISTETDLILGDVNSDGNINLEDAIIAQKYSLSLIDFFESQKLCADVDEDSNVNTLDAIYILKYSVNMPTEIEKIGAKWFDAEYEYIEHPAETEEVLVTKEAYTITEPLYEKKSRSICFACGADILDHDNHIEYHIECGDFEDFAYTSRDVWVDYYTDEWVVKNESEGLPKPDGFQGAEKARTSADILIAQMVADSDEYVYGYRYIAGCGVCNKTLEEIITVGFDNDIYESIKNISEEHKNQHIANGERSGYFAGYTTILYKITTVPEESHYETQIIKEAWTEEILVKEAGWY